MVNHFKIWHTRFLFFSKMGFLTEAYETSDFSKGFIEISYEWFTLLLLPTGQVHLIDRKCTGVYYSQRFSSECFLVGGRGCPKYGGGVIRYALGRKDLGFFRDFLKSVVWDFMGFINHSHWSSRKIRCNIRRSCFPKQQNLNFPLCFNVAGNLRRTQYNGWQLNVNFGGMPS